MRPATLAARACGLATWAIFWLIYGLHFPTLLAAMAFVAGWGACGRAHISRRAALGVASALVVNVWLACSALVETSIFAGSLSFRLAFGLVLLLGLSPVMPFDELRERGSTAVLAWWALW